MKAILRYLGLIVLAVVAGVAAGTGWSWYVFSHTKEDFFENQWPAVIPGESVPVATLIGSAEYEFSTPLNPGESRSHEFLIRNDGFAELEVTPSAQSDQVSVDPSETVQLRPGTTYPITVTVTAPAKPGEFEAAVELNTNDPEPTRKKLALRIRAQVAAETDER